MSTMTIHIPDYLRERAEEFAARQQLSFDEVVSLALASHVSAWMTKGYMEERAKRGSYAKLQEILQRAPDVEPELHDRLPES